MSDFKTMDQKKYQDPKTEKDVKNLEIDSAWKNVQTEDRPKTILDIPELPWINIKRQLEGHDSHLLNACLSSSKLERLITQESVPTKLKLLGERVFSVLVLNFYLNQDDLQNCLDTNHEDIRRFAGRSWWCFGIIANSQYPEERMKDVSLLDVRDVVNFSEEVSKKENLWDFFKDKIFYFYNTYLVEAGYKDDAFWNAACSFVKTFGNYIVGLKLRFRRPHVMKNLYMPYNDLLKFLPRVRFFDVFEVRLSPYLEKRTFEVCSKLVAFYYCEFKRTTWLQSLAEKYRKMFYSGDEKIQGILKTDLGLCEIVKVLDIFVHLFTCKSRSLVPAELPSLSKVETITFSVLPQRMKSINLLDKFPNVKDVTLFGIQVENDLDGRRIEKCFPRVKKLTWRCGKQLRAMNALPKLFPNLKYLYLKSQVQVYCQPNFDAFLLDSIDIYQLLARNVSLKSSNIWIKMRSLQVLCFQNFKASSEGDLVFAFKHERIAWLPRQQIYTRMLDGTIRFEDVILAH